MWRTNLTLAIVAAAGLLALCVSAQASDPNLVAHWMLDEGTGLIAYDSAGNNDGTLNGDPNWTTGQVGGALEFDGLDDYVDCGSEASLEPGSFTISAWIKPDDVSSRQQIAGKLGNEPVHDRGYGYRLEVLDGKASLLIDPTGCCNGKAIKSDTSLEVGQWYFVAGTYGGSTGTIYVDGQPENSDLGTLDAYYTNFFIGARFSDYYTASFDHFNGAIDDVRVYDRVLSAEEIEELYWEGFSWSAAAIRDIEDAIAEKLEALETIDAALEKEWAAYDALDELLASEGYEGLSKRDIAAAQRKIESSIRRQQRSKRVVQGSIEELEDALLSLGWEPEPEPNEPAPEPNVPEPNVPVPGKRLKGFRGRR